MFGFHLSILFFTVNHHMDKVCKILYQTTGKAFDFQDLMYRFTLDSIGQIALGYDFGSLSNSS
jgi:hypothetical protein